MNEARPADLSGSECRHCSRPVPATVTAAEAAATAAGFCCHGCAAAWEILHESGLADYYALRDRTGGQTAPVAPSGRSFLEVDEAGRRDAEGAAQAEFAIRGLQCAACVWAVEKVVEQAPGVAWARVDLARNRLRVRWDPEAGRLSAAARRLDRMGYELLAPSAADREAERRSEERSMWLRLGVAGALAGNLMLLSVPLHAGEWSGIAPAHAALFRWASWLLSVPLVFYAAAPFHRSAWGSLRSGILHVDLPISAAVLVAWVGSSWAVFRGEGGIFFESLGGLVFLLLIGRYVMFRGRRRAEDATQTLVNLGAATAWRREGEAWVEVPSSRLAPGDRIRVSEAQAFAVDGRVLAGEGLVDVRILTGESVPLRVAAGDAVVAGTRLVRGDLEIEATAVGAARRIARIAELAGEALSARSPVVRTADRLAGIFVVLTLVLSLATGLWYWLGGDPAQGLTSAVAVAIVLCPCALGLGTPLALAVAHGAAARRGIMVKGAEGFERLAGVDCIVFDKTGTLTRGEPRVLQWLGLRQVGDGDLADWVAAVERDGLHPWARAFAEFAGEDDLPPAEAVQEHVGRGIEGRVGGHRLRIGSDAWLGNSAPARLRQAAVPDPMASRVWIELDGQVVAAVWIADPVSPDAAATLQGLRGQGYETVLLSGDHSPAVQALAARVGVDDWLGEQSVEQKLAWIQERRRRGSVVAMVGDGVNDAAALAAADAGIAVRGAAEAAMEAADFYLLRGDVAATAELLGLSRRAMQVIRRNVVFSLLYNVVGTGLAVTAMIGPLGAALLMPASSLTILLSSLGAGRNRT